MFPILGARQTLHTCKKRLHGVKKAEDASKSFLLLPSASALKSILTEVCACTPWMVLRQGSQGGQNMMLGHEEDQEPED